MLKNIVTAMFVLALIVGAVPFRPAHADTTIALQDVEAGDLIRGQSFSAVYYYGKDGFRYVFPNDKTYFTWYEDFDDVMWVSDADLGKIQIGGNVTYRPGVKMVKINTDPKTYVVDTGGSLRWVETEEVAETLFGSTWNSMIDDVPDGFFSNYSVSDDGIGSSEEANVYETSLRTNPTIDEDKGLTNFQTIEMTDDAYSATQLNIAPGDVVRFVNNGSNKHTATADDLTWGSGTISPNGGFWQRRFEEVGEFSFFCSYHPEMTATIMVQ